MAEQREGPGRKKGVPNKINADLKEMILGALAGVGGQDYLHRQAELNPGAFLTLIGKVLPMQITGEGGGPVFVITGVDRDDDSYNSNDSYHDATKPASKIISATCATPVRRVPCGKQRWSCIVAHRRAGKTVACIMDLIDAALRC